ncbi:MAG: YicC family protein [Planctomycetes bacterium]|nr:YicC family protein [Planctomycetota bacterium]
MTGFGRASAEYGQAGGERSSVTVEVKSVNNRFLKTSYRIPDLLSDFEPELDTLVRSQLSRGSVYLSIELEKQKGEAAWRLNPEIIEAYFKQLTDVARKLGTAPPTLVEVSALDGVVEPVDSAKHASEGQVAAVRKACEQALKALLEMRRKEGEMLAHDLSTRVKHVAQLSAEVEKRAPQVVQEFRDKLNQRIETLLKGSGVALDPAALVREVAFFADRCDVTEETTRLKHHCTQFLQIIAGDGAVGRRLDFIAQELLRESNTIGSKANDAHLISQVVEMKSEVERIKEQVQNLE